MSTYFSVNLLYFFVLLTVSTVWFSAA